PVGRLAHAAMHLGGYDQVVAVTELAQQLADDLLAGAIRVHVGGVEEVDAGVERRLQDRATLVEVHRPRVTTPVGDPEAHGAEADGGHVDAGRTELHELHAVTLARRRRPEPAWGATPTHR